MWIIRFIFYSKWIFLFQDIVSKIMTNFGFSLQLPHLSGAEQLKLNASIVHFHIFLKLISKHLNFVRYLCLLRLGMAIQSEINPSPTRSEENNPIRVRGKGYPTPTPTSWSESELETDRSWTLLKIRHSDPTPTLKICFL